MRTLIMALTSTVIWMCAPRVEAASDRYPQDALRCLASRKEPEGLLICPEHRNGFCVKEVSTLQEEDCGRTSYFGDKWNKQTNKCEYRKCGDTCEESSWDFEFEGEAYERNRFCCGYDYCNGGYAALPRPTVRMTWMVAASTFLLVMAHLRHER